MKRTKVCPSCNGSGVRYSFIGRSTCGQCLGTGKINPRQKQDFVSAVRRQFGKQR